jgi:mannose-6-phosphate isomerase-like protein (cupin superfamily)
MAFGKDQQREKLFDPRRDGTRRRSNKSPGSSEEDLMPVEIVGPGEGRQHYSARGSEMFFKAMAEQDDGDLSLMERTLPVGGRRPPPHRHTNCSEAYFVLDGLVSVVVDGDELVLGREAFVLVPRGTGHTFGNAGDAEARLLVIHAPAMDAYFAELHELWQGEPPAPVEERALMSRFGMEPA